MAPETLFLICNYGILPAWLLLAVAPSWSWTQRLVHGVWIPLVLGVLYASLLLSASDVPEGAGFGSLAGVMLFFTSPTATLAGWVHYLVFDLFVGAWEVRDARRRGIAHGWVLPCLALTLLFGPTGLLLYLALRFGLVRATSLEEGAAPAAAGRA